MTKSTFGNTSTPVLDVQDPSAFLGANIREFSEGQLLSMAEDCDICHSTHPEQMLLKAFIRAYREEKID